jgi:glutamyl-tRNA synthetase
MPHCRLTTLRLGVRAMTVTTRFAPSPTGTLHVGNLRTALHNWLFARRHGGTFLLRIDDTDKERSQEVYVDAIRADLAWMGLHPDAEERQSARFDRYEARFAELAAAGRVYPAYETAQELDLKRKVLLGRGLPPVYDRAALALTDEDRARLEGEGRAPHWRFRLDHESAIEWDDLVRGPQRFDPKTMSDPVIRRADGSWLYLLPSVIDDIDMAVTHVVRGEDHVSNTATQLQMFAALGSTPPAFAHEALLTGSEGKLSKRLGSLGIAHFREIGIEPQAIASLLGRIGTSDPVEPFADLAPLIAAFDFARFGRAPARFDEAELAQVNARIVHQLPYAAVADRVPQGMDEAAWDAIRPNLETVAQAGDWWRVVEGPIEAQAPSDEDRAFLTRAAELTESLDWSADPWRALTGALKEETGRKGKALFLPLRLALTGREHGPDMGALLPLIGKDRAVERLRA